ncbi:MAG TPA: hypothetical protein DEB06_05275 [Phycisphaerales bacterium]|nr:hypothetical protein [Phycisphaerales bacterium]
MPTIRIKTEQTSIAVQIRGKRFVLASLPALGAEVELKFDAQAGLSAAGVRPINLQTDGLDPVRNRRFGFRLPDASVGTRMVGAIYATVDNIKAVLEVSVWREWDPTDCRGQTSTTGDKRPLAKPVYYIGGRTVLKYDCEHIDEVFEMARAPGEGARWRSKERLVIDKGPRVEEGRWPSRPVPVGALNTSCALPPAGTKYRRIERIDEPILRRALN